MAFSAQKEEKCVVGRFMYQLDENLYKVSLRAVGFVDVAKVAAVFGGGGHVKAAGATMQGTCQDIIEQLAAQIEEQLK